MSFKYVIAIVRPEVAALLEAKLSAVGVGGITLTKVKGFGEYKNLFSRDWLSEYTKVERGSRRSGGGHRGGHAGRQIPSSA